MYILSQVIAGCGFVFTTTGRLFKKQEMNLLFNVLANLFFGFSYFLLSAYAGMLGVIVSIARSFVFYLFVKKMWKKKLWLLLLFLVAQACSCGLSVLISKEFVLIELLLAFAKGGIFTYASWQHNPKVFRVLSIVTCVVCIAHDLLKHGYVNALAEFVSIIFIMVVIVRIWKENKKRLQEQSNHQQDNNKIEELETKQDTET